VPCVCHVVTPFHTFRSYSPFVHQEPEKQPDYASQTKTELEKVQQKAILLNDMLNNIAQDEQVGVDGDAYEQVSSVLKAARPKIQKWIGDAGEDNADLMGTSDG
jgi:ADP-ribosylation factor-binding protein GGA